MPYTVWGLVNDVNEVSRFRTSWRQLGKSHIKDLFIMNEPLLTDSSLEGVILLVYNKSSLLIGCEIDFTEHN